MNTHSHSSGAPDDPHYLEALEVALEVLGSGAPFDPETFRRRFPAQADTVLSEIRVLLRLDGMGRTPLVPLGPAGTAAEAPPDRLGDFEIVEEIGRGGAGVVYAARQTGLDRTVAVKVLSGRFAATSDSRRRFEREAALAARLSHPAIVKVHAFGEDRGALFLAMERIEGASLQALLAGLRENRTGEALFAALGATKPDGNPGGLRGYVVQMTEIGMIVADALAAAHAEGLIHRDVKPANILLDRSARPHLADFGLAREHDSASLTATGHLLGTPAYLAPECVQGQKADARSDVFSLGATLYEALTGQAPFRAETSAGALHRVLHHDPPPLDRVDRRLPEDLANVIARALEKEPVMRYPDAVTLRDDLRRFLQGEPVSASRVGFASRMLRRAKRRPWQAALAAALAVALVVAGFGVARSLERASADRREARTKLEEGKVHLTAGDVSAALSAFRDARRLDPERPEVATAIREAEKRLHEATRRRTHREILTRVFSRHLLGLPLPEDTSGQIDAFVSAGGSRPSACFLRALAALGQGTPRALTALVGELPADGVSALWLEGERCRLAKDADGARAWLARARSASPRTLEDHLAAVEAACFPVLDQPTAEGVLRRAASRWPRLAFIPFRRGYLGIQGGRLSSALDGLNAALRLQPDFLEARALRAFVYRSQGRHAEALEECEAVLARDPDHAPAIATKALALFWSRKREASFRVIGEALGRRPDELRLVHCRGRLRQLSREFEEALADYHRSVELGGRPVVDLVGLLYLMKRKPEADEIVERRLASRLLAPEHAATLLSIQADYETDLERAERQLRRSLAMVRSPGALWQLGGILLNRSRFGELAGIAAEQVAIGFRRPESLARLGACRWMLLDPERAVQDLDRAIEYLKKQRFTDAIPFPYFFRAMAARSLGDTASAIRFADESLKRKSDMLTHLFRMQWLMQTGDEEGVKRHAREAGLTRRNRRLVRAWLTARQGKCREALDLLESVDSRMSMRLGLPQWPSALFWLGLELAARTGAHAAVGRALMQGEATPEAVAGLVKGARDDTERAYLRWAVGRLHLDRREVEEAIPPLEDAVEQLRWTEARLDLGCALVVAGEPEEAFALWDSVKPGTAAMYHIVTALTRLGVRGESAVTRWLGNGLER